MRSRVRRRSLVAVLFSTALSSCTTSVPRQPIHVSLPGYSADGAAAVIYAGSACGPPCGQGVVVLLERSGEAWKMITVVQLGERKRGRR